MRLLSLLFLFTGAASAASKADLQRRDAGVVHDGQENKGLGLAPTTQLQSDHVPQLTRRDVRLHTVVANESANIPDLEQYVKSKIQPDEEKTIYPLTLEGKTFGWSGVVVDDAAKEEIAKQKGVVGIRESLKAHKKRALPQGDWSQKLTRRAGKWVKQEDSDEALNVDSQYRKSAKLDLPMVCLRRLAVGLPQSPLNTSTFPTPARIPSFTSLIMVSISRS